MSTVTSAPVRRTQAERVEISGRRMLAAAAELLAEKGWEATTAAEIGRRAGYSRAMVHARFGSKDALLDTLFHSEYEARLNPPVDESASGLQRVHAIFGRLRELAAEDPMFLELMFVISFEAAKRGSPVRPRIVTWMESIADAVEDALRVGVVDGSVRPEVDVTAAASEFLGAGIGIAYGWIVLPGRYDLVAELERLRMRIDNACCPPRGAPGRGRTRASD